MSFQSKLKEAAENLAAMATTRISDLDRKISELAQEKARLAINAIARKFLWSVVRVIGPSVASSIYALIAGSYTVRCLRSCIY